MTDSKNPFDIVKSVSVTTKGVGEYRKKVREALDKKAVLDAQDPSTTTPSDNTNGVTRPS